MPKLPKIQIADTTPSFDEVAVREHVGMLHHLANGLSGKFVVSTFFANPAGEDKAGGVISHHSVGDVDGTVDAVMAHAETPNANTYICPNLMRPTLERGKKGGESDVVAVLALVADMDDDTGRSGTMPVDPNYVVESSPGNFQCFLLLDTPLSAADAKPLARSLKVAANADHCTVDMAHVWRVPGTLNWPNAKKLARGRHSDPAPVNIAELWNGEVTNVENLRIALQAWSATETSTSSMTIGELPKACDVQVGETSAEMLAADDVGDRSAHAAKVVEQLAFDGLAAEQACAAFLAATGDWFARYEGKDAAADFARLWGKFGAHHAEERRAGAAAVAGLVAKRTGKDLVAANDNVPNGPTFSIFDWTVDRFKGEPPKVEYLVDGVMPAGVPGMVSAMGDTGKSYAMLELHRRVSFGSSVYDPPIFGGKVLARGTSVMITSEDDAGEVHRRIAALDQKEHRFSDLGRKMIVVPLPSAGGAQAFWKDDKKKGMQETDYYRRVCDQLLEIDDLRLVTFDPLASFAHLQLNEDPAAGQFVCSSLSRLATETGATVLVAHHMRKTQKPIETLGDARDSIRGSTALVDGLRLAYAMWPAEEARARKVCKTVGVDFMPGKVVLGGVVKANGAARRVISTYVRNDHGLLVDKTAMLGSATPPTGDLIGALVVTIEAAANAGAPFTKTGASGVFEMRERLPDELRGLAKARLHRLVDDALDAKKIVRAAAKGEKTAKWLDVPGGYFATGLGSFTTGAARI
ncbi:AAA family ATPase [Agrobacterium pusense]|uniref:AAA family ATPase n=1 Tax=Agrobacterium pusense TaxID=648995 RepID=UPI0028A8C451|nr:AAA family ATPase [Agrobacterium pusense]